MNQIQKTNAQSDTVSTEPQFCQIDLICKSLTNYVKPVKEKNKTQSTVNKEPEMVSQAL